MVFVWFQVPSIMIALQRSVHSVLLGKVHQPDWLCRGIRQNAHTDDINISKLSEGINRLFTVRSYGMLLLSLCQLQI